MVVGSFLSIPIVLMRASATNRLGRGCRRGVTSLQASRPQRKTPGLARSRGFIGHDSGISHLAAALGLPGVVLWGGTSEAVWRPPSEKVVVLKNPGGLAHLPVDVVLEQVQNIFAVA